MVRNSLQLVSKSSIHGRVNEGLELAGNDTIQCSLVLGNVARIAGQSLGQDRQGRRRARSSGSSTATWSSISAAPLIRCDETIPRENFRYRDRLRAFIHDVRPEQRRPQIFLSRAKPDSMTKLFAQGGGLL